MPVIVVGTEKNFAALRPRLFEGQGLDRRRARGDRGGRGREPARRPRQARARERPDHPRPAEVAVRGDLSLDDAVEADASPAWRRQARRRSSELAAAREGAERDARPSASSSRSRSTRTS